VAVPRSDGTNRREAIVDAAVDPHLASLAVFGALNWIYSWYMPDGKLEPEQVADLLVTHIMNGLLPRETAP